MLFNASAPLTDRLGKPCSEARPGDKEPRLLRHGDVAVMALDTTVDGDEKLMRESPERWIKAVMRREMLSQLIAASMQGDGCAVLKDEQKDLLYERLALCALRMTVAVVGPVMHALDNPPERHVAEKAVAVAALNGASAAIE